MTTAAGVWLMVPLMCRAVHLLALTQQAPPPAVTRRLKAITVAVNLMTRLLKDVETAPVREALTGTAVNVSQVAPTILLT